MAISPDLSGPQPPIQKADFKKIDVSHLTKQATVEVEYQGKSYTVIVKSQNLTEAKIKEITHRLLALTKAYDVGGKTKSLTLAESKNLTQGVQLKRELSGKEPSLYSGRSLEEILQKRSESKEAKESSVSTKAGDARAALELLKNLKSASAQSTPAKPALPESEQPAAQNLQAQPESKQVSIEQPPQAQQEQSAPKAEAESIKTPSKQLVHELKSAFANRSAASPETKPAQQPPALKKEVVEEQTAQQETTVSEQGKQQPAVASEEKLKGKTEKQPVEAEETVIEESVAEKQQEQPVPQPEPEVVQTPPKPPDRPVRELKSALKKPGENKPPRKIKFSPDTKTGDNHVVLSKSSKRVKPEPVSYDNQAYYKDLSYDDEVSYEIPEVPDNKPSTSETPSKLEDKKEEVNLPTDSSTAPSQAETEQEPAVEEQPAQQEATTSEEQTEQPLSEPEITVEAKKSKEATLQKPSTIPTPPPAPPPSQKTLSSVSKEKKDQQVTNPPLTLTGNILEEGRKALNKPENRNFKPEVPSTEEGSLENILKKGLGRINLSMKDDDNDNDDEIDNDDNEDWT